MQLRWNCSSINSADRAISFECACSSLRTLNGNSGFHQAIYYKFLPKHKKIFYQNFLPGDFSRNESRDDFRNSLMNIPTGIAPRILEGYQASSRDFTRNLSQGFHYPNNSWDSVRNFSKDSSQNSPRNSSRWKSWGGSTGFFSRNFSRNSSRDFWRFSKIPPAIPPETS